MKNFFIGILLGSAAILPGISCGVFCVIFGLYEKIVNSITNFFKNAKENFLFLFPIFLGAIIGIFVFGNILKFLFVKFPIPLSFIFIGLILGSINLIFKQIKIDKINFIYFLCTLLTLSLSLYLISLEQNFSVDPLYYSNNLFLIIAGILMSAGIIIPGVSKTVILIMLGLYEIYLDAITSLNLSILFPICIGLIIGGFIFLFILNSLFKYFKNYTYFGIIGFVLGSVFVLYPGFTFNLEGVISISLLFLSFILSFKIKSIKNKKI